MRNRSASRANFGVAAAPATGGQLLATSFRLTVSRNGSFAYTVRLASNPKEVRRAQALRFTVLNSEPRERPAGSCKASPDGDEFDTVCDHLIVEDQNRGQLLGTCRLQSGARAAASLGYECGREFDMAPFAGVQRQIVELGCACVARTRGSLAVMELLWRGIAFYARTHQARYVITCSSLQTQDRRLGASLYASLYRTHLVQSELRTQPLPGRAWPLTELADEIPPLPVPLAAHLALGSRICGPPALNSRFDTMDFLTVLDFENLSRGALELGVRWPAVDKSNQPSRSEARPDLA